MEYMDIAADASNQWTRIASFDVVLFASYPNQQITIKLRYNGIKTSMREYCIIAGFSTLWTAYYCRFNVVDIDT